MVRFKCIKCGKIVEYLRIFKEIPKEPKCSCGGDLQLINNSSNEINKGGFLMKIAMPVRNGYVNEHFGTTQEFAVIEVENGKVKNTQIISNEGLQHNHGGIANMLKNEQIEVIICGGIGGHMIQALQQMGIKVVNGAAGPIQEVAEAYAAGTLVTRPTQCGCGGHHHHHHGGGGCH